MKKNLALALALISLLLVGCGRQEEATPEPTPTAEILSKGDGFLVTLTRAEDYSAQYAYTVTAKDGTVIEQAVCGYQPKVAKLKEGELIGIRFFNDHSTFCRYYDLVNGRASQSYFGAFWDNGTLLAYDDYETSGKLVVCDIFNADGFRSETKIDGSAMELVVTSAEANEENTELTVHYTLGESGADKTVKLPLA